MKNRIITTIIGLMVATGAFAQQDASFSQYFFNPLYFNPAYAGSRGVFSGTMVYRDQWVGVEGAPNTESVGMHGMIPGSNVGLGMQFYNDNIGPLTNTEISAIFAYHLHLGEQTRLSFGIEGCMDNVSVGMNKISIENTTDPSFTGTSSSAWAPDANVGLYLYKDRFFAGFSVKHLLQPDFEMQSVNIAGDNDFYRCYYLTAGFVTPLSDNVGIRPSILAKYVSGAPIDIDLDASLIFYNKLYIGAGLRTDKRIAISGIDNALVLSIEYDVANYIRLGYSYDFYLSPGVNYSGATNEIMLGWDIFSNKTKMTSPKYF
ncbi:MAG: type IX secretion system membrane protein PorP/SprF [Bacteroidia bacterium]